MSSIAAAPQGAAHVPEGATPRGILELTRHGEVIFLPKRNKDPFSAIILTQSTLGCSQMQARMLNVEGYPKLWDHIKGDAVILERSGKKTRYALHLDLPLSPDLEGLVEDVGPGKVTFHDTETGGAFAWTLRDVGRRCHMQYRLYQPPGKESPFVGLVRRMEDGVGDSAELAAALATARGYSAPVSRGSARNLSTRAQETFAVLSGRGIALRAIRRPSLGLLLVGKRRIAMAPAKVLQKIRNRERAARTADFLDEAEAVDGGMEWKVRYFKGAVDFTTTSSETGDIESPMGLVIEEKVSGGDITTGHWRWRVRAVPGGTDVELEVDLDITKGSYILRTLTAHDTTIRDAARFQMVFSFLGDHLGGRSLPVDRYRLANAAK